MKKAYLALSVITFSIPFAHFIVLGILNDLKEGYGGLSGTGFVLRTIVVGGIPLLFWIPASLASIVVALAVSTKNEKLKNACLAFPILTTILIYTSGEYYGP